MSAHEVRLLRSQEVAEGTRAFHFSRPPGFAFKAGQAIDLVLPAAGKHAFSIVSAPFEEELAVATRMRDSEYKRALGSLGPGSVARVEGPFGSLTLHRDASRAAVFIAGGIGITPFMSILRQVAHEGFQRPIALLYSNRRPEDAAFLDELQALARSHPSFRLVATMTGMGKSRREWSGETRLVGPELLRGAAAGLASPVHYLAGPPAMVAAALESLEAAGVDESDLRTEEFYGY